MTEDDSKFIILFMDKRYGGNLLGIEDVEIIGVAANRTDVFDMVRDHHLSVPGFTADSPKVWAFNGAGKSGLEIHFGVERDPTWQFDRVTRYVAKPISFDGDAS